MTQASHLVPLWATALIMAGVIFVSLATGYLVGNAHRRRHPDKEAGPVGAAAGACLGLLAFLLAFTFSMANTRLDARKALVLEESNVINTAWLRSDLLAQPQAGRARDLLVEYVDTRTRVQPENLQESILRSEAIQRDLWAIAVDQAGANASARLFAQSVNDLIGVHSERLVFGLQYRIPVQVWMAFFLVVVTAMLSLGYMFGLGGTFRYPASLALAIAFSAMILLISDMDRPAEGFIRVDPAPLLSLQARMAADAR